MGGNNDFSELAPFAATLDVAALDAVTLSSARACLLYGLSVGIATLRAPTARPAAAMSDLDGASSGPVTRLFDGARLPASDGAFANAVLLSGRVQGDSHPCGHIGGVVVPTALAVGEQRGLSGANFLAAMIAGYEVALRIGRDHSNNLSRHGFRTTPSYGVFGAAAAYARGLGFDTQGMGAALGLAANLACGLREYVAAGTQESPLQAGFAARNGVSAALMVAGGIAKSCGTVLTGNAGFYQAFGGKGDRAPARRLNDALGEQFEFTNVTYKPYPICQFFRDIVRGMSELRGQAGNAELVSASVAMVPFEANFIGAAYQGPFASPSQTAVSAPFCAALGWRTGTAAYQDVRTIDDAETNALTRRITVRADPARQAYCPKLEVTLNDGRTLEWLDEDGINAYTLTWDRAIRAAPALLAEMEIPDTATQRLIDACGAADRLPEVTPIIAAARAAIAASPYAPK